MDQNQPGSTLCAVCGTNLRATDRYCPSCGAPNPGYARTATDQPPERPTAPPTSPRPPDAGYSPPPPPSQTWEPAPAPPRQSGNRNTWLIIGGIALFFLIVCCCCALLVAVASSQDSALQDELEGTATFLLAVV